MGGTGSLICSSLDDSRGSLLPYGKIDQAVSQADWFAGGARSESESSPAPAAAQQNTSSGEAGRRVGAVRVAGDGKGEMRNDVLRSSEMIGTNNTWAPGQRKASERPRAGPQRGDFFHVLASNSRVRTSGGPVPSVLSSTTLAVPPRSKSRAWFGIKTVRQRPSLVRKQTAGMIHRAGASRSPLDALVVTVL